MAHETLVFPIDNRRIYGVTTVLIMGSAMALAQLELIKKTGAVSKPAVL